MFFYTSDLKLDDSTALFGLGSASTLFFTRFFLLFGVGVGGTGRRTPVPSVFAVWLKSSGTYGTFGHELGEPPLQQS